MMIYIFKYERSPQPDMNRIKALVEYFGNERNKLINWSFIGDVNYKTGLENLKGFKVFIEVFEPIDFYYGRAVAFGMGATFEVAYGFAK